MPFTYRDRIGNIVSSRYLQQLRQEQEHSRRRSNNNNNNNNYRHERASRSTHTVVQNRRLSSSSSSPSHNDDDDGDDGNNNHNHYRMITSTQTAGARVRASAAAAAAYVDDNLEPISSDDDLETAGGRASAAAAYDDDDLEPISSDDDDDDDFVVHSNDANDFEPVEAPDAFDPNRFPVIDIFDTMNYPGAAADRYRLATERNPAVASRYPFLGPRQAPTIITDDNDNVDLIDYAFYTIRRTDGEWVLVNEPIVSSTTDFYDDIEILPFERIGRRLSPD